MEIDEIGPWSEIKLEIIQKYAVAYSSILSKQKGIREHVYIDAFAGAGVHQLKGTDQFVTGSPLNALLVKPPFKRIDLIDLNKDKADNLRQLTSNDKRVRVFNEDCNTVLLRDIFPQVRFEDFKRGLCLLDPYGLHLNWNVLETAGRSKSIEIFLNFPIMDMNQNVLWNRPDLVDESQRSRMNAFWGDESWRSAVYDTQASFFGWEEKVVDANATIASAFQKRLKVAAGFDYVPEPIPMRNSKGATVYYLFFASPNKTGAHIVKTIFDKYRKGQ